MDPQNTTYESKRRPDRGLVFKIVAISLIPLGYQSAVAQLAESSGLRNLEKRILAHITRMRASTVAVRVGTEKGSGVIVSSPQGGPVSFVITTGHVVDRIGQTATIQLVDGTARDAQVQGIDRVNDVALLRLSDATGLQAAELSRGQLERTPTHVVAVGNPGGFQQGRASLVRFGTAVGGELIQSTCHLARGDSGGPLFDLRGRVVGIHRHILKGADSNFHSPSREIAAAWPRLLAGETITGKTPVPKETSWEQPPIPDSAHTNSVVTIRCAGKRVSLGTIIDSQRGWIVTKASELSANLIVSSEKLEIPGTVLHIDRARDIAVVEAESDWPQHIQLHDRAVPAVGHLVLSLMPDSKPRPGILGATARRIQRRAGELGVVLDDDMKVASVSPNSAAKKAGLRRGDILTQFGGNAINSTGELGAVLQQRDAGDPFEVGVTRNNKTLQLRGRLLHPANRRFADETFQLGAGGSSSLRRSGFPSIVQHDATIKPSDCGGPVTDLQGNLVGINIARVGREAVYMVPVAELNELLKQVERATE